MGPCLDENVIAGFVEGRLGAPAVADVMAHLETCEPCFALIAALAGENTPRSRRLSRIGSSALEERFPDSRLSLLPVRTGQIFAERYRVDKFLASGGYGAVFAAHHLMTEAPVALKILWSQSFSRATLDALELEAKVGTRAKSDFIVSVLDAGVERATGLPFLAMELLQGCSLFELVRRNGPLSVDDAILYLSHVAHGLDRAHNLSDASGASCPVVHRDLKPENLFLATRGQGPPIVKILDFGLAKLALEDGTVSGTMRGTPCYMACEQITCDRVGPCTDVWAFGLVAFFLLAGRHYWLNAQKPDAHFMSVLTEVLHGSLVAPSVRAHELGVRPSWPAAFDRWFLGCLQRDPKVRFQSISAAYTALLESLVAPSSSNSLPALTRRRPRRREPERGGVGSPPLGAHWDGRGVSFALFSEHATAVELCLYDPVDPMREVRRIHIPHHQHHVWQVYVEGARPGQPYGYRVDGPFAPRAGQRFNPNKLLLDPYARSIRGAIVWNPALLGHDPDAPQDSPRRSELDSAPFMARSIVTDSQFPWGDERRPKTPWAETLIYEAHVKGMTMTHPEVPEHLRGTYLGLASDAIIEHLLELGVTAIELLPVQQTAPDGLLVNRGLSNYWGYWTIGYFAPDVRYATGSGTDVVAEFKGMVRAFHQAGIEVLLDVAYNHTAEGDHAGPTLCFRGIDNANYYRLLADQKQTYEDFSSCGNSLSLSHPRALQLVLDSLRYWVQEMHVDGFRFDLGTILGRDAQDFDRRSRFLAALQQDPVLRDVKLIAEPWDVGPNGYRLGAFPPGWSEWNDRYSECVRRFWRGDPGQLAELAERMSGSPDIFDPDSRGPEASINFVTCHDGFTLHDLVSYERQQEPEGLDAPLGGWPEMLSSNWGEEGPTAVLEIIRQREVMKRNFLATLALSAGVPMLLHGDELGRSQRGNANAYCHDSDLAWINWDLDPRQQALLAFAREVFAVVREHPELRPTSLNGRAARGTEAVPCTWSHPDGTELTREDWADPELRTVAVKLDVPAEGMARAGKTLLIAINGGPRVAVFALSAALEGEWCELLNTSEAARGPLGADGIQVSPRSLALFCRHGAPTPS